MNSFNLLLFSLLLLTACSDQAETKKDVIGENVTIVENDIPDSGFVHAVYFYLNEDLSEDEKKNFKLVLDTLAQIPSIEKVIYGPPAMTPRKVVDNTYDYAWITFFKDKAGHDAYQDHPIHSQFKERYLPIIADVKIYDNLYP